MSIPDNNRILTSPEGIKMKSFVTEGFYDRSYIGLWMYQVMGLEFDDMRGCVDDLKQEVFIQSATWSIPIWEFAYGFEPDDRLPLDYRRWRILSRMLERAPMNPARVERIAETAARYGVKATVTEHVAPYTFRLSLERTDPNVDIDFVEIIRVIRQSKPSHKALEKTTLQTRTQTTIFFGTFLRQKQKFKIAGEVPGR